MAGAKKVRNPLYGVCYSFNYIGHIDETKKARQVSLPGQFYGLTMELDIEAQHYLRDHPQNDSSYDQSPAIKFRFVFFFFKSCVILAVCRPMWLKFDLTLDQKSIKILAK